MKIPIIDLFAGPGGLGEGFSSNIKNNKRVFDIKLSIEKDENAFETLRLRSFYRKFEKDEVPNIYYDILKQNSWEKRRKLIEKLSLDYKKEWEAAENEAWNFELPYPEEFDTKGNKKGGYTPREIIDRNKKVDFRIREALNGEKDFLLIGGPPCQAYSLVGRSRNQGISTEDHRVHLYKEYLRIIAKHQPAIFVMENVKGLLSAKVKIEEKQEKVFDWIKRDLQNPSSVFPELDSKKYKIYSLSTSFLKIDTNDNPVYEKDMDYLIKSEQFGIPQKRHRVILLGIREDIKKVPEILTPKNKVSLGEIIEDLPEVRSGLNRTFSKSETKNGKTKRIYNKEVDSSENWNEKINNFRKSIISWNGFARNYSNKLIDTPINGVGAEYISTYTRSESNPLKDWYNDPLFEGVCNHESRSHLTQDLKRYMFSSMFAKIYNRFPRLQEFEEHSNELLPDHKNVKSGKFADRFRVQLEDEPATTVTSHISKDGHYFIHYDPDQCRSLTVREAARIQTFPDNYLFCGSRTAQYHQVGNAVPPYLANQISDIVWEIFKNIK